MTDKQNARELLELAAKAKGGLVFVEDMGWIEELPNGDRGNWWNPIEDDGDALRLISTLYIDIEFDSDLEGSFVQCVAVCPVSLIVCGSKKYINGGRDDAVSAAIRQAATCTAAKIGRATP